MAQPKIAFYSDLNVRYNNPLRIEVDLFFEVIVLNGRIITTSPDNINKYTWILTLDDTRNRLTFEVKYRNTVGTGTIVYVSEENKYYTDNVSTNTQIDLIRTSPFDLDGFVKADPLNAYFNSFLFFIKIDNPRDLTTFREASLISYLQISTGTNLEMPIINSVNRLMAKLIDETIVELIAQTDQFGLNLGEMTAILTSDHSYSNGYPKKLIGYCLDINNNNNPNIVQTFYSFRPKLSKVLKGEGTTLLAQTNNINCLYDTDLTNCDFYLNILAYCTLRYMLAGLSNNSLFSLKWLYANYYEQFLINLKNSEFSAAVVLFTEPQGNFDFTNFNRYFKTRNNINH
jgi:hypothetical protein